MHAEHVDRIALEKSCLVLMKASSVPTPALPPCSQTQPTALQLKHRPSQLYCDFHAKSLVGRAVACEWRCAPTAAWSASPSGTDRLVCPSVSTQQTRHLTRALPLQVGPTLDLSEKQVERMHAAAEAFNEVGGAGQREVSGWSRVRGAGFGEVGVIYSNGGQVRLLCRHSACRQPLERARRPPGPTSLPLKAWRSGDCGPVHSMLAPSAHSVSPIFSEKKESRQEWEEMVHDVFKARRQRGWEASVRSTAFAAGT